MPNEEMYFPALVKPKHYERLGYDGKVIEGMEILISGNEYLRCCDAEGSMWGNGKAGRYGSGLIKHPFLFGLLGEMAFGKAFGFPVNLARKEYGEASDFNLSTKKTIDVKTNSRLYPSNPMMYIMATNDNGASVPLKSNAYVAGFVDNNDQESGVASVVLIGYCLQNDVPRETHLGVAAGSRHYNYEIPYGALKPLWDKDELIYLEKVIL